MEDLFRYERVWDAKINQNNMIKINFRILDLSKISKMYYFPKKKKNIKYSFLEDKDPSNPFFFLRINSRFI